METEAKIGKVNIQEPTLKSRENNFQNTIAFIETAFTEGAHFKVPKETKREQWERDINITVVYLLNPDETLEKIGKIFGGITRERVKQIRDKTINDLWLNCSTETQTLFPIEGLKLALTQKAKELMSKAKRGKSVVIQRGLQAGKSIQEIQEENGLSIQQIVTSRYTLRKWGMEAPPYINTPHSKVLELEKKLRNAEDDQEKQNLLNQVKRGFYHTHIGGDNPLLVSATDVFREAGFSLGFQDQNFTTLLVSLKKGERNEGFPIGEIQVKHKSKTGEERIAAYHFLLNNEDDIKRAKAVLIADPNLQRFRRS